MSAPLQNISIRSVALPVYLPSFLIALGEGAIIPVLPAIATTMGASLALAGFIAGLLMIGQVVGDVPSGWVVARLGETRAMMIAAAAMAIGVIVCIVAPNLQVLSIGVSVIGLATSTFALARHSFLTTYAPFEIRARALSTLGGTFRGGYFVGPFLAAAVIPLFGVQAVFWVNLVACLSTAVVLLILPDPAERFARALPVSTGPRAGRTRTPLGDSSTAGGEPPKEPTLFATIVQYRSVLGTLGTGALLVGMLRASRQVMLPLWAVHLNLDTTHTAIVIGAAAAVDFGLFYTSGQIMDRFGRAWSAVPSMIGLGLGHVALVFTGDVLWFAVIAILMSIANGIGSGILMTLGSDLAPKTHPAPFLGAWRFFGDSGNALAPAVIAVLTAAVSLTLAGCVLGGFGLAGAALLARYVPALTSTAETTPDQPR